MNRPMLFGLLFGWLVIITFLVNAVVAYDPASGLVLNNPLTTFEANPDTGTITQVASLLRTFWGALTFNIEGLPFIFNLFFQIPTAIIGVMTLMILRGV